MINWFVWFKTYRRAVLSGPPGPVAHSSKHVPQTIVEPRYFRCQAYRYSVFTSSCLIICFVIEGGFKFQVQRVNDDAVA